MKPRSLEELRQAIEEVDHELMDRLARRLHLAREVVAHKGGEVPAIRDASREHKLYDRWSRRAEEEGLSPYFFSRILRELLHYSRRLQESELRRRSGAVTETSMRVGFQGVAGAFSEIAVRKLFGHREGTGVEAVGFESFEEVIDAVVSGQVDQGLLPIENTIAGSIHEVYRLLVERPLHVVDEEQIPVDHCLAALPGVEIAELRTVRSHPVALQQCSKILRELTWVRAEAWSDTAAAAESVAVTAERDVAALCSEDAARHHGLEPLRERVQDFPNNRTRFWLVSNEPEEVPAGVPARCSMVFGVAHRSGALASALAAFAAHEVNLTKLESRTRPEGPGEALFYVDADGNLRDQALAKALEELRVHCAHLRVLGCYPRRLEAMPEPTAARPARRPEP